MTDSPHAVIARLSTDFAAISRQLARVSSDLTQLDRLLSDGPPAPQPEPSPQYATQPWPVPAPLPPRPVLPPPPPPRVPPPPPVPRVPRERSEGWIGKVLAVAGVAVTLIGVVLLLVLAAQAGILRPEIRVGAGALLAAGLVAVGCRVNRRDDGRVGGIALTATGIAAAYFDVIAITTIYEWVAAPVGLVLAAAVGGAGLTLARRWHSEHLGLLVLVPLIALAPLLTDGVTLLLVAFMLALSAATLPVQLGRDWIWLHAARTAAVTLPLLAALAGTAFDGEDDLLLAAACGIAALLALAGALLVVAHTARAAALALLTAAGVAPVLCVSATADRVVAALMIAALSAALLAIVLSRQWLPAVSGIVAQIWSALSAVSALIAVTVAFDGEVAAPLLLAMAAVVAVAGRDDDVARCSALGFAVIGGALYLAYAPPTALVRAVSLSGPDTVSVLVASLLLIAAAVAVARSWTGRVPDDTVRALWVATAAVAGYAVTAFMVTAGVLVGGTGGGFFAGHVAATVCWMGAAAGLFGYAARRPKAQRPLFLGAGLALVSAAMAKLFLFDLGTLDGMFRVTVFLVVGLILLGMGAGYARLLAAQDQQGVTPITQ
ncbi:DUF2339 domain-containing protein [Mycolicibacterium litorale]|uniref:Uncharacterized protein n=1 Tax=Mycolicibacterium litorale TaxID=758802 RepID=A0AAD1IHN2_9MYCO|nr:DUF2339 domain-containing protein [Mycolicibacterium litorale]MCV7414173.1 DUF2339 domain-containing protein [Mycolicibacterium litorale]TDY02136.1 putative membrane protein DUF2339 [Mycolicibacterium litorale]BBY15639.1 hypothetical protein MLIT_12310 [Mycolicibacterium litorale]